MSEKSSFRPLHGLVDHEWNPRNVRRFFWALLASLESWLGWGLSAWRNTYNARTNTGANNANGAVIGVIVVGIIFLILSLYMLWDWEERRPTSPADETQARNQRIAQMEKELLDVA